MSGSASVYQPLFRSGTHGLFTDLSKFWVTKEGSRYLIYNKDGNLAQSSTDFQEAMQAQLDSISFSQWFHFDFDAIGITENNPVSLPVSSAASGVKYVTWKGFRAHGALSQIEYGTTFNFSSSFPTESYAIEGLCQDADVDEFIMADIDGFNIENRTHARAYNNGGLSVADNPVVIDAGGIKIRNAAGNQLGGLRVRNIHTFDVWRALVLQGEVWFSTFENIWTKDASGAGLPNRAVVGDHLILLQSLSVATATNSTPKANHFRNLKHVGFADYKSWLRIRSGSYNIFDDIYLDGGVYEEAPFNLDNEDDAAIDSGCSISGNQFRGMQIIDTNTLPSPDNRKGGCLYLNGSCTANFFHGCLFTLWPAMVRIAGGARRNQIYIHSYLSAATIINDMGAGDGNAVFLMGGFKQTPGLEEIDSYSGIAAVVDLRSTPYELIGFTNTRVAGQDHAQTVDPQGWGLLSHLLNLGTPTSTSDSTSAYLQWSYVGSQNVGRVIGSTSTSQPKFTRQRNPRMTVIFQHPAAGTGRRMSLGFSSVIPTTTTGGAISDTLIANTDSAVIFGHDSDDTTFKVYYNGGSGSMASTDTGETIDADVHIVQIWASESGVGTNNKWRFQLDGYDPVEIDSSSTPAATTVLYPHCVVSRPTSIGTWRLRPWQIESK